MKKYLKPLSVFIGGHIVLLFLFLFFPAIGTVGDQLAADTAAYSSTFWNWDLVSGTTIKFLVFIILELLVLFFTAKTFLNTR